MNEPTTLRFRVPLEHHPKTLATLLRRAWSGATDGQITSAFHDGRVLVDERPTKNADRNAPIDGLVTVEAEPGAEPFGLPEAETLARAEDWVVVEKPVGMAGQVDRDDPMNPVAFLADMLGLDRDTFTPAWPMPARAGGPWLCGTTPEAAQRLADDWQSGSLMTTWVALVATPPVARGQISGPGGLRVDYSTTTIREGISEIQLTPQPAEATSLDQLVDQLLEALAGADMAALGDVWRGGYCIDEALKLRVAALYQPGTELGYSWQPARGWWPADPVVPPSQEPEAAAPADEVVDTLTVSPKTLEVLSKGHPWVLSDRQTGRREHIKPGTIVQLESTRGIPGPFALVEGTGELAARVWSEHADDVEHFAEEVDTRVDEALSRRAELLRDVDHTDLFRLIHGEADGLPGLLLDRVGPLLRATIAGAAAFAFRERVYENLRDFDPDIMILEVEHLRDVRKGELPQARVVSGGASYVRQGKRVVGFEDELKYWCEPWEGIDVGFFADQRQNRRRLREIAAEGDRWLNLFCHTGAFTAALVDRGCHVTSVDLSKRYLDWLEANLDLNGLLQANNDSVAADAREFVSECDERFDGIIVDPPTASSGAAGFWSVRKDYEDLLVGCFDRLADGGTMLVCRNDKRSTEPLEALVRSAARRADRRLAAVEPAPPAPDFPTKRGFPEGDAFEGVLARST